MTLDSLVHKLHILAGVQAAVGLLIFSLSVLVASFPSESQWQTTPASYSGTWFADDLQLARAVHREIGQAFEQVPQRWMLAPARGGALVVRFHSPNGWREVQLNRQRRSVEIRSKPAQLGEFLNFMHQESVGRRKSTDSAWLWAWSLYLESGILALFVLPLTGSYIWLSSRPKARFAQTSLGLSVVATILLWVVLR